MNRAATWISILLLAGCASLGTTGDTRHREPYRPSAGGTIIWGEEFQFSPPPEMWKLLQVGGGDEFGFAFLKNCREPGICVSTFAYDEEPFGASRDLAERMKEFYSRFLWGARIRFGEVRIHPSTASGGPALAAEAEGRDEVKGEAVRTKVVLTHRGERVVGFYLTQWRAPNVPFDDEERKDFDAFVASFRFLRPSFYDTL